MGIVVTPLLCDLDRIADKPIACAFCGGMHMPVSLECPIGTPAIWSRAGKDLKYVDGLPPPIDPYGTTVSRVPWSTADESAFTTLLKSRYKKPETIRLVSPSLVTTELSTTSQDVLTRALSPSDSIEY